MTQEEAAPIGLTWRVYVERLAANSGGFTALAEALMRAAGDGAALPADLLSVEKGIRRLVRRGNASGGQYGRWLLRYMGLPEDAERWARWLAQYHRRSTDLPLRLRLEQLQTWERPPFGESRLASWTQVGLASVHMRLEGAERAREHLDRARAGAAKAGAACVSEVALLDAYNAANDRRYDEARLCLDTAQRAAHDASVDAEDRACLDARVVAQHAYLLTKPLHGQPDAAAFSEAQRLFENIPQSTEHAFVAFRKCNGLAYCAWKLGDRARGLALAREACTHAGDGGFVRFRVLALTMIARMLEDPVLARATQQRAARLARSLDDEDLFLKATKWLESATS